MEEFGKSKNQLKRMALYNKKHNKGWGWFVHPNAGNVEYNNAVFNSMMASNSTQSLAENKELDEDSLKEELIQSDSDEAFKKNVETELKAGKPRKLALAIAYSVKEKNRMKKENLNESTPHKYVITMYEKYPIYEAAEGGYYYDGVEKVAQTDPIYSELEAKNMLLELAKEEDFEFLRPEIGYAADLESHKYIGEGRFMQIESNMDSKYDKIDSAISGYKVYEEIKKNNMKNKLIKEGAEGKRELGIEYVIYRDEDEDTAPIVGIRSTYIEAKYFASQYYKKHRIDTGIERVPKGRFKVGDDFQGPFDLDWNLMESNKNLNESKEGSKNAEEAFMMGKVIGSMDDEYAYDSFTWIWPDGDIETVEDAKYFFNEDEDFEELRKAFLKIYKRYHKGGLFEPDEDTIKYAHKIDKELNLPPIEISYRYKLNPAKVYTPSTSGYQRDFDDLNESLKDWVTLTYRAINNVTGEEVKESEEFIKEYLPKDKNELNSFIERMLELDGKDYKVIEILDSKAPEEHKYSVSKKKLESDIKKEIRDYYSSWSDEDFESFIGDYLYINVDEGTNPEGDNYIKVEIRSELDYDELWDLMEKKLDPYIQNINKDAYFDFESPGIINAYLFRGKLMEGRMKDIDIEIQESGGKENYIKNLQTQIKELKKERDFTDKNLRKMKNLGGAYDNDSEVDDAVEELNSQITQLENKLKVVNK